MDSKRPKVGQRFVGADMSERSGCGGSHVGIRGYK